MIMEVRAIQGHSRNWVLRQILSGLALTCVTTIVLVFSLTSLYGLEAGDVAPKDVRVPRDLTYESEILSLRARESAVQKVQPVYTRPNPTLAREQLARVRNVLRFLSAVRADTYASNAEKITWVRAVSELAALSDSSTNTLLVLPSQNWNDVQLETRRLLDQIMRQQEVREQDLSNIRGRVPAMVPLDMPQDEAALVSELVQSFMVPNVLYNEIATEAARQKAWEETSKAIRTLSRGQIVFREGSIVTDLDIEALEALGLLSRKRNVDIGVSFLVSALLSVFLGLYIYQLQPQVLNQRRQEILLLFLLAFFMILAWLLIPSGSVLPYLFPSAALAMLVATTIGPPTAIGASVFLGITCGWLGGRSLDLVILVVLSSLVAIVSLPQYEQAISLFRSGLLSGLFEGVALIALSMRDFTVNDLSSVLVNAGGSVAGGVISGGLALGGLFLLAYPFDLTSTFRLIELSRPNHPLLQRLLREAPGTFQHSMMVASMAELAAERIGANALLTRVGTYMHDVGKLMRPYFFIENQAGLNNPHDRLDPYTSVSVLTGHVRDGVKLADEYHLPSQIKDFILEHHGTMQVSFFYRKAVEAVNGESGLVDESEFRYPGPKPQSRETALLMLADGSEAATRARRPQTAEELDEVIGYIFNSRINDGQLDECPITMHELQVVRATYVELLKGAYHPRLKYPEPKKDKDKKDDAD